LLWGSGQDSEPIYLLQDRDPMGEAVGTPVVRPRLDPQGVLITNVVLTPAGRVALSWMSSQFEIKTARLNAKGQLLGEEILIAKGKEPDDPLYIGDIEVDSHGNAVVTWTGDCRSFNDDAQCDIFAQRLSLSGPVGAPIRVNTFRKGVQEWARVAVAPDGRFLVVWQTKEPGFPENPFAVDVSGQLLSAAGAKIGPELHLGTVPNFSELFPEAAADPNGNFIAVWSSFRRENGAYGWDILGRLFRHDGRHVGKEFRINTRQTGNEFAKPQVAFGGNGTFVVVWNANDGDFDGVFGQRFMASAADEACLVRGESLLCDSGRSGGEAELQLSIPGGSMVLGDVDGDGRKDPCVFEGGRFQCDTDHRGMPYETPLRFGQTGDVPLFGDVDGDGRDEPCVRRGRVHLCDTGRNGGRAESSFGIGSPVDQPLLGDLDGDGRDDACVFDGARFLCDTRHNGRADLGIVFGHPGDLAVLGDFDGDGDDDPCVFRMGKMLCDTAHDGNAAETELIFGQSGDRPLLGNLDGL
jgi:hypothetical protein